MSYLLKREVCDSGNLFNGEHIEARISSVFVILALSALGSFFPLVAKKCPYINLPKWCFFITRYFGSGVIVATGFIHLLAEAGIALSDECLGGVFTEYPWAEGISLMGVFFMFFIDIVAHKKLNEASKKKKLLKGPDVLDGESFEDKAASLKERELYGDDKECHSFQNTDNMYHLILNSFLLEFGIVFHSVFVGLSLAIAGNEFKALYIAIAFHQMFEGLGLGTRFAITPWPKNQQHVPWLLALGYSLTTPVAIAVGLGARKSYPPGSRIALITTGCFDAACSGLLIYNSLVELMAFDFMFSPEFDTKDGMRKILYAYLCLSIGAGAMALLGKWA